MNREEELIAWIWASNLGRNTNKNVNVLKNIYGDIVTAWKNCEKGRAFTGMGIDKLMLEKLLNKENFKNALKIFTECKKKHLQVISLDSEEYPNSLRKIYSPPSVLYYKGNILEFSRHINGNYLSVVGSRRCSSYGRMIAFDFSKNISRFNIGIVSGMARGIDSEAHRGALWGNGYTVAVLGCGADVIYPKENKKLYEDISERGCVLSEYPPGTPPYKNNFPARNRIVSGLSSGTLIVEAAEKSGAMITVDMALEQGKNVYVIPGNINSINSRGCNELIKNGAICVTDYKDILSDYFIEVPVKEKEDGILNSLKGIELEVYKAIINGAFVPEDIVKMTQIHISEVLSSLTMLEIKGILLKSLEGTYKPLT